MFYNLHESDIVKYILTLLHIFLYKLMRTKIVANIKCAWPYKQGGPNFEGSGPTTSICQKYIKKKMKNNRVYKVFDLDDRHIQKQITLWCNF